MVFFPHMNVRYDPFILVIFLIIIEKNDKLLSTFCYYFSSVFSIRDNLLTRRIQSFCINMLTDQVIIIPYISYITLGSVALIISLMVLFKFAARDNRFLSNSELYIYSRPDVNQRKNNVNKKQLKDTFLIPKSITVADSIATSNE